MNARISLMALAAGPSLIALTLPLNAQATCDAWLERVNGTPPAPRFGHTAVWTGSEMIVWGGFGRDAASLPLRTLNTGGRYDPVTNNWTALSTSGAPDGRENHTAVWTGSEMIVWGGSGATNTGGRYNPATDTWTTMTTTGAPAGRFYHTAVWTGSEMIVWGGGALNPNHFNDGGRYNPLQDSWTAVNTSGAPAPRNSHTAVWTGTEMIIWGGDILSANDAGGRYRPASNTWTAMSTSAAPAARHNHTAAWTGSEMIVWGGVSCANGFNLNTGGRYNPSGNNWTTMTTSGAPSARSDHTVVWTGSEMIVWGGKPGLIGGSKTGGSYNPAGNSWSEITTVGAPLERANHTAVWTGSVMIVWGGHGDGAGPQRLNDGGRYDPVRTRWTSVTTSAPPAVNYHTAVWTGSEMIVWGRSSGGRYNPTANTWTAINTLNAPMVGAYTAVWTGSEMIVWGVSSGRYNPASNSWTAVSNNGAPSPRNDHTAVWTGSEMIVWGGSDQTGGRYRPSSDSWLQMTTIGAPLGRGNHNAVWTGTEMIIWGGTSGPTFFNDGGRYNPMENRWVDLSTSGAPDGRKNHTAVWTGSEMIVWGGYNGGFFNDGGRYNPASNSWTLVNTAGAPALRHRHTAVWTGREMIVWGGKPDLFDGGLETGGSYNPAADTWTTMTTTGAPAGRSDHTAVWTGSEMIVWGGSIYTGAASDYYFNDTFSYTPGGAGIRITSLMRDGGTLTLGFPSVTGCNYSLWRSDTLAIGSWVDTGLTSLTGTGAILTFTIPVGAPPERFFRVQVGP